MFFSPATVILVAASTTAIISGASATRNDDYSTQPVTISYKIVPRAHGTSAFILQKPAPKLSDPNNHCLNAFQSRIPHEFKFNVYRGQFGSDMPETTGVGLTGVTFAANITSADRVVQSCKVVSASEQTRASYKIVSSAHGTVSLIPHEGEYIHFKPTDDKHICLTALAKGFGRNALECDEYGAIGAPFRYCHPSLQRGNFTFIAEVAIDEKSQRSVTSCEAIWWKDF